ncbi:MAG: ROK family transcriptional regulator [Clostridia bacterium]|nr:ROK family transcriptional regulator [Clostridia bacterium]
MKKYLALEDMVNTNCAMVLDIIQKKGTVSRKEITEISELSWGGMTKIVNKLLEKGYIIETKSDKGTTSGRTPTFLSVNTSRNFIIGLDINLTGLNAIVINMAGTVLENISAPAPQKNYAEFLSGIIDFIREITEQFEENSIISLGIAMQGIVDHKNGISVKFPGVEGWENVPLRYILEKTFGINVFLEHDPDCLLYSHLQYDKKENITLLRIDKSIGMAVALYGKMIKGEGVFEIAHNIVVPNGKHCICGQNGCLQAYISPCMKENIVCESETEMLVEPLAITIKNLSNILCSDKIILTGTLMKHKHLFEQQLDYRLKKLACNTHIEFSEISGYAERGAALIALHKSINSLII